MKTPSYMRSRLFLLGVVMPLLAVTLTACFGSSRRSDTPVATGTLIVTSTPPNADVFLDEKPTGKKTTAKFEGLAPGLYEVKLVLDNYPEQRTAVRVDKGVQRLLDIKMNSKIVEGRVIFGRGGPPVAGSVIEAIPEGAEKSAPVATTESSEDGTFTLSLEPGRYTIMASQPDTWARGVARNVQVPTSGTVEIIQRELFIEKDDADPDVLSIKVEGLEPGDVVSEPIDVNIDVEGINALDVRYIGVRVGHRDPYQEDHSEEVDNKTTFKLKPSDYPAGSTYLYVVAYDVQLNSAQLTIPLTIARSAAGDGQPLPAPANVEAVAYTFLVQVKPLSIGQIGALADALSPYGVSTDELIPEPIAPYNRWVRLSWEPLTGAGGYRIYRRTEGSSGSVVLADWPAGVKSPVDTDYGKRFMFLDASADLYTGVRYYYSVRAYDEAGNLGPAAEEIPVVLLEPFEVSLEEPAHGADVAHPVRLSWNVTQHPSPLPGYTYDYIYGIGLTSESGLNGLLRPDLQYTVQNTETFEVPVPLTPGRTYQWDLVTAYVTTEISPASRAFAISGRYNPNRETPAPGLFHGGSINGAFFFTMQAPSQ